MHHPLRFEVEPQLDEPVLALAFRGWNDAGEAASSALEFLNQQIHAVPLASIEAEEFFDFTVARPEIVTDEGRIEEVLWPDTHFAFGQLDDSRSVVTGLGVEPHTRWRSYTDAVLDLVRRLGVRRVVMMGAYLADVVYSRPVGVTGFSSEPAQLDALDIEVSGYQGPTGVLGVLADRLQREGVEILSLWAGLPHYLNASPNPRGALALIHKLGRALDCKFDDSSLQTATQEFEERISRLVDKDPELREYVRQLKKRDFVQ